jgi:hypothetical protein
MVLIADLSNYDITTFREQLVVFIQEVRNDLRFCNLS